MRGSHSARALRRRGIDADLIERAPAWSSIGTGIYMPGNGVRALEALGLDARLAPAAPIPAQRLLDRRGRCLVDIELDGVWGAVAPCLGMRRIDLHRLLVHGALGVPIRFGTTVQTLTETRDSVGVVFDDGTSRAYDVVVGADGLRSSIRRLVFGDTRPRYVGQVCWRFLVPDTCGVTTWTAMLARDRAWLMMPVGRGGLYCYADLLSPTPDDGTRGDGAQLRTLFGDFAEPVPSLFDRMTHAEAVHFAPIEDVMVDPPCKGRVVLIGDAAHATSPNMAEGASMALEDAVILGELLARDGHPINLLAAFADRRRARIRWVQERTRRRDRIRGLPEFVRNLALRLAGRAIYRQDYGPLRDAP
ncbi:MAG: FAD-dependent monooxygenase [Vicinamibacteraceae bacterium]